MDESRSEVAIDIGGGAGEYFTERANSEPQKTFLVLEPKPVVSEKVPSNLHVIQWLSDKESGLPLKESSVDEANIHFLYGVISDRKGKTISSTDISEERKAYRLILKQLKNVLKRGADINILEVRENAFRVDELLKEEGFEIESPPKRLENEELTTWTSVFFEIYKSGNRPESESHVLPMEIKARWNPK